MICAEYKLENQCMCLIMQMRPPPTHSKTLDTVVAKAIIGMNISFVYSSVSLAHRHTYTYIAYVMKHCMHVMLRMIIHM